MHVEEQHDWLVIGTLIMGGMKRKSREHAHFSGFGRLVGCMSICHLIVVV